MVRPMQGILYIHNAIIKETSDLEEATRELDRDSAAQLAGLKEKLIFFDKVLQVHEGGEEEFFFPPMAERESHVASAYVFDHNHHGTLYAEVMSLVGGIDGSSSTAEKRDLSRRLARETVALNTLMNAHVAKENELLVPVFEEFFSIEEQGEIIGRAMSHMGPEMMAQLLPWMFMGQTGVDDRVGMMQEFQQMVPPQAFTGMVQMLSQSVDGDVWQQVVNRMPELKQPGG